MATSMMAFRPAGVVACASSVDRRPDVIRRKSNSSNWWSPLFGWSGEADYIDSENKKNTAESKSEPDPVSKPSRSRNSRGTFTDEKAKQLRRLTADTSSYHDIMYHSAIASRLASDFSGFSDRRYSSGDDE